MTKFEIECLEYIVTKYEAMPHDFYGDAEVTLDRTDAETIRKAVEELKQKME